MESILQGNAEMIGHIHLIRYSRGLVGGLIGGLAGTLAMDIFLMAVLSALGLPALACFSIVGTTVARFFSIQGVDMEGAIRLGVTTHYLIGPLVGGIYGVLVTWIKALRVKPLKKSILFAILYVEILSQPLLATTPILLKMTGPVTLQWYAGSFVMHLLFAVVLGAVLFRIIHTKTP